MRLRRETHSSLFIFTFIAMVFWTLSIAARAETRDGSSASEGSGVVHEIKEGETLGGVALAYGVTVEALMEENGLTDANRIFFGQNLKIPGSAPQGGNRTRGGVEVLVPKGFTLSRIAVAYEVSPQAIIRANKLDDPDRVREGQKLLIPGAKRVVELVPPPPCYKSPITIYRVRTDQTLELSMSYCNGKPNLDALQRLSKITEPKKPTNIKLHPRLARLLQTIADRYPGKRIEIISGQRAKKQKKHESYHNKGRALDFRVEGVSNYKLCQYVRSFKNVGVGYYPNSVFIHMDVRDYDAYWIDYSEPGEKAIYARKGLSDDELEDIRSRRRERKRTRTLAAAVKRVERATKTLKAAKRDESEEDPGEEASAEAEDHDSPAHANGGEDILASKEDSGGESPTS